MDFSHAVSLSHANARRQHFVRNLVLHRRASHDNDPARFAEDVLAFYDSTPG